MIVRLTNKMRDECIGAGTDLHRYWLDSQSWHVSHQMWDCVMPAVGWQTLSDRVIDHAFTPLGRRRGGQECIGSALRRISRQRALVEGHPGLTGVAMPGKHFHSFLAWGTSPYPQIDEPCTIRVPHYTYVDELCLTTWRPMSLPATFRDKLLNPSEHWAFIRLRDTPSEEPAPSPHDSTPADTTGRR